MFPQIFSNFGACKLRVFQQSCVILLRNLFLYFTMKQFILALFVLIFAGQLSTAAQKKVLYGVAFYNVENLFDTNHDAGKKDYDFLPTGSYQWTENKYQSKLSNMAQVISELCTEVGTTQCPAGAAVVGLSEVENARVLSDLLQQPSLAKRGYKAIHFEGPDRRGIDVAMLYNPKAFHLESAMLVPFVYRDSLQPNVDLGFYQGADVGTIVSTLYQGPTIETKNEMVDKLLARGGLLFMMETISLVICALSFGGAIKAIGAVDTIIETILKHVRRRGSIIATNVVMSIFCNFAAADQYMSIVIPGQMYKKVYKQLNMAPENLSRTLEDAGTLTSGLVPWSTCGAVYLATLNVSAFAYGRYHLIGIINPIIAIVYAYAGIFLNPLDRSKPIKTRLTDEDIVEMDKA